MGGYVPPRVSVVLPVFNGREFVRAAVQSMCLQSFRSLEVVVVDDGSSDGTGDLVSEMAKSDPRIRLLVRPNTGIVGALNDGIAAARGEYIARMDADDIAMPHRIARQIERMEAIPSIVALGAMWIEFSNEGRLLALRGEEFSHNDIVAALFAGKGAAMLHPVVLMRRSAVEQVGGYRRQFQHVEDFDLFLRLAEVGALANLDEPLLYRRMHEGSICAQRREEQQQLKRQVLQEALERRGETQEVGRLSWSNEPSSRFQKAFNVALSARRRGRYISSIVHAAHAVSLCPSSAIGWQMFASLFRRRAQVKQLVDWDAVHGHAAFLERRVM